MLTGKTALICGSSQGIGKACAYLFAQQGCRVVALARSKDKLEELVEELNTLSSQKHSYIHADLLKQEEYMSYVEDILKEHPIDILVNNSSGPRAGPLVEAQGNDFLMAFHQHLIPSHNLTAKIAPRMKQEGYGRIINILSTSVKVPIPNLGVSNTVRAAVASWAKTLSLELGPYGITVNNVLPGFTQTSRLEELIALNAQKMGVSYEKMSFLCKERVPLKRFASPEEIASAILFLASPAASYVSGVSLPVDGGRTECF